VTQTKGYTSWGKPYKVQDASGRMFTTTYDLDGQIQSISQTSSGVTTSVATYAYGTTAPSGGVPNVRYGQVLTISDDLSGVIQSFDYAVSGGGIGQVSSVAESGGGNPGYSVGYTYTAAGDRSTVTYSTPNGNTTWQYTDFVQVGKPMEPTRAFRTFRKLDSTGKPTAEEFHYDYDTSGRLMNAAFAQTPKAGFTPSGSNPWYDSSHPASSRGRAHYTYDPSGRVLSVEHYWDTASGSTYTSEAILANTCSYETGGLNRGLKTQSQFWTRQSPGSASWTLSRTEGYSYDPSLDYLVGASYGDGLPDATPTWAYDAAGNRTDATVDNLNRATAFGAVSCTNDILGNRLTKGATSYGWDSLNRMTSLNNGTLTTGYQYRVDDLRVKKSNTSGMTLYRYDGQMGMQDVESDGSGVLQKVTDYALAGRGIDAISTTTSSGTAVTYPLYDAHGNMISTLSKASPGYSYSSVRSFDAWGSIRQGATSGDPKGRYCANLGHKQDDESGFLYMRARYYEPSSGRFLTEDPSRKGQNWFGYCANDPINRIDQDGRADVSVGWCAFAAFMITFLYVAAHKKTLAQAFVAGLVSATSAGIIALGTNAIGRATEMSAIAQVGAKFFGGGFVNGIAQLMIDLITGDSPGGDLALAFFSGAASPFLPAYGNVYDAGQGAFLGSGLQALYDAGVSALE